MKELEQNFTKQGILNDKEKNELNEKLNIIQKKYDELFNIYKKKKDNNNKKK
jgi:hypothetical protein